MSSRVVRSLLVGAVAIASFLLPTSAFASGSIDFSGGTLSVQVADVVIANHHIVISATTSTSWTIDESGVGASLPDPDMGTGCTGNATQVVCTTMAPVTV